MHFVLLFWVHMAPKGLNYEFQNAHNQSYVDDYLRDLAKLMRLDELFTSIRYHQTEKY